MKSMKTLSRRGFLKFLAHQIFPAPHAARSLPVQPEGKPAHVGLMPRQECIGCGLCSALCPAGALTLEPGETGPLPRVDEEKCTSCGLCVRFCPGLNRRAFQAPLGEIQKMVIGWAKDSQVRRAASSGGAARCLLQGALQKGLVDAVIITRATEDPYRPETIITDNPEDLRGDRINSLYSPTSPLAVMDRLEKGKKYALAGLPCHIAGITGHPKLRKQVVLTLGLFCSHTPGYPFLDRFLKEAAPGETVKGVRYRGQGWPGRSALLLQGPGEKEPRREEIPFVSMWHTYNYHKSYQQPRCRSCTYYSAETADISLGDPWVLAKKDHQGTSLIFVRSDAGQAALDAAQELFYSEEITDKRKEAILAFHIKSARSKALPG